jgi:hypothetical protein
MFRFASPKDITNGYLQLLATSPQDVRLVIYQAMIYPSKSHIQDSILPGKILVCRYKKNPYDTLQLP